MKKFFVAAGVACMVFLSACSSVDSKIDKLEKIMDEVGTLAPEAATGNMEAVEKIQKLSVEAQEIAKDLKDADLTPEQQQRLVKATMNMVNGLM